jgi:hypothetical protein
MEDRVFSDVIELFPVFIGQNSPTYETDQSPNVITAFPAAIAMCCFPSNV